MKTKQYFLLPALLFALAGCSNVSIKSDLSLSDDSTSKYGGEGYSTDPSYGFEGDVSEGGYVGETGTPSGEETNTNEPQRESGQLTCSALDDNAHYDFWKSLATSNQEGEGQFQEYKENFAFNTFNRLDLTINNGTNVTVKVKGDTFATKVDNLHKAYLFPQTEKEEYEVEISYIDSTSQAKTIEKVVQDGDIIDLEDEFVISNNLEIMFVIDATGSMGDEMEYIKAEIDDVISQVKEKNAQANITLAMMVYRDKGDDYITKYSDFTSDISAQQEWLKKQRAEGGGDFEEAVQTALDEAINKQWSSQSTKLLFHVADAPAHDKDVTSWNQTALLAARKGIKIITVASSGINLKTEYFFRSQSLLTSGQYVYLTNDSGIGGDHLEATTEDKLVVEYLNECLVRLINGYYSGTFTQPISWKQSQQ